MKRENPGQPFTFRKSLGQHFLTDPNIIHKIIDACQLESNDSVLEIGPGDGALTRHISPRVNGVYAVDADRRLCEKLSKEFFTTNVKIIHANILKFDLSSLPSPIKVIGNLPYNISSPIIERIMIHREKIHSVFFTVQWEFGKRLVAKPNTKDYSSLSCFVQNYADVKILFQIKKSSFYPSPKVTSCFLRWAFKTHPLSKGIDEEVLFHVIRLCFQQRRKTIANALSRMIPKDELQSILHSLKIDSRLRAENLSINDYIRLTKALDTH